MPSENFKALVLRRPAERIEAAVETLTDGDLPAGDVLVRVHYSDVGYKDGLAITGAGHRQLVQSFPFVPGVDFAGVVELSDSVRFKPGDEVIVTGWGVGERHWGGYAKKARVKAEWLVPVPAGMTMRQAMTYGSAGLSAMLCVNALERHGVVAGSDILVTGATGGVGSVAVMLLHRLGYRVHGSTSRAEEEIYLRALGADEIVAAKDISELPAQPLLPERWTGAIDNVGGATLANVLASTAYGGAVAALGLVGGTDLQTTVLPFIKRGVALLGVDSEKCPNETRGAAWRRLVEILPEGLPDDVIEEIGLEALPARAEAIMRGKVRGRTLVAL
ncbi:oxidoreductase [Bradyrhizobium sp. 48]|uniref:MDR family oxidoreductase n=1 Tax=Bradyrhizobium sp. 48 TaxID=2782676 RepID=UPI001FFAA4EF|nr:MDR family oxidoreductase [Bradyrhizobium sp. 48]MCK1446705.1 oxidoreductase [Bradyrhizobium sp. 48]